MTAFESDRPVIFSLEEIEDGTKNFDETRKIGEGGYGVVYFGVLGEQVWQVFCWVSRYLSRHNKPFQFFFLKVKKKFFFFLHSGGCDKKDEILHVQGVLCRAQGLM